MEKNQATFTWEWQPLDDPRIVQLAGSGRNWSPRTYVALMTDLFERGVTRCLVGTRGIFGEGWDALSLNTLVDLTSVTTRTGVQQIRGRSLRLDPQWPRKVAHNWDVVCTSKEFDKGDADLRRFVARHQHTWGIVAHSTVEGFARSVATRGPSQALLMPGRVTRGVAHVDMELAADLHLRPFKQVDLAKFTQRMLDTVGKRDQVYELWGVGEPYSNDIYDITRIEPKSLTFRTARTVEKSLRAMLGHLLASVLSFVGLFLGQAVLGILAAGLPWVVVFGAAVLVIVTLALVGLVNVRQIGQIFRRSFLSMPADDVLLDIGQALLAGLKDAGVVSDYVDEKSVRVEKNERDGNLEVFVDYASPEDSKTFSQAYRELVGPLGDARYLIERDSTSLRNPIYHPLWRLVRRVLDLEQDTHAYHAVPAVLASHRERAEALAHHWKRYVGGGRLVYTRTDEGGRILLQARAQRRKRIQQMAFEIWT